MRAFFIADRCCLLMSGAMVVRDKLAVGVCVTIGDTIADSTH